ncbi:MAG TPA: bifunctional 4-hydroxy-2-oxoglutarate aldolase/2-dehydro-3-deoxy-phosphogluconate aldolase [Hyphomicrobiales bacterium]|nr:bifunctional 4-hydroxy-2-oxoglutarate aldolase/2-dehydro-3-deoxy-phosphogluconate aldolase [Hyphomicrobiales bacterium]
MSPQLDAILHSSPVIPVITLDKLAHAVPLAQALLGNGLKVLEITLRTPVALDAIRELRAAFPTALIGAGTVVDTRSFEQALAAGAQFVVSPGSTPALLQAARDGNVPFLPGANTPSEVMRLLEQGVHSMKFFPAEAAGGTTMLKALAAPLPQARFCPTGGITPALAPQYLALPNVACVGGSWMVSKALVDAGDWLRIGELAGAAAAL